MNGPPRPVVGLAACIYGPVLLAAGLWVWLRGEKRWVDELLATAVPIWQALGAGLAIGLAAATLAVFAALGVHILNGGAYETRTVIAMTIRSALWVAIASAARFVGRPSGVFDAIRG